MSELVVHVNKNRMVSSKIVAEKLRTRHRAVLRRIRSIKSRFKSSHLVATYVENECFVSEDLFNLILMPTKNPDYEGLSEIFTEFGKERKELFREYNRLQSKVDNIYMRMLVETDLSSMDS
jgi:phage regulator Rha-like protein